MRLKPALARLLTLTMLLAQISAATPRARAPRQDEKEASEETSKSWFRFRLSEGAAQAERPRPNRVAEAARLPDAETARLLARLPPLPRGSKR